MRTTTSISYLRLTIGRLSIGLLRYLLSLILTHPFIWWNSSSPPSRAYTSVNSSAARLSVRKQFISPATGFSWLAFSVNPKTTKSQRTTIRETNPFSVEQDDMCPSCQAGTWLNNSSVIMNWGLALPRLNKQPVLTSKRQQFHRVCPSCTIPSQAWWYQGFSHTLEDTGTHPHCDDKTSYYTHKSCLLLSHCSFDNSG